MTKLYIQPHTLMTYSDVFSDEALKALEALAELNEMQKHLMQKRNERRKARISNKLRLDFLSEDTIIGPEKLLVADIRKGQFESSVIPDDLNRQWIQGTGPAAKPNATLSSSIRNVAYALLSGADGWMFDGEDALGQIQTMSLDNQRNLKLAIAREPEFMETAKEVAEDMNRWGMDFLGKPMIENWLTQLDFTTIMFRARGLHLDDRHITQDDGSSFSASITDVILFVTNNYHQLQKRNASIVLYLPKIQTAEEAAFWNTILTRLEQHLGFKLGTIKTYVLVEQLEATFQLQEIRAALGKHFVGFNTGRWDYINSVSDELAGNPTFINPNIESITMTYSYMAAYEDRVRRAVNTPDKHGNCSLWQGGMEPNIPVGSEAGVQASMKRAISGAERELAAGASGKWVAHWKMVPIIRPVWEKWNEDNQLGRSFPALTYSEKDREALMTLEDAPRTIRGARNLLSVALQYGNAFLQGYQAAALKPADFFGNDDILYLMEDMATGEIRVSVLWEWLHKGAKMTEGDETVGLNAGEVFTFTIYEKLLDEEYQKLLDANTNDVHDASKGTTLPIVQLIVDTYLRSETKAPWFIDLLNLNLNNEELAVAEARVTYYFDQLKSTGHRITENMDLRDQSLKLSN